MVGMIGRFFKVWATIIFTSLVLFVFLALLEIFLFGICDRFGLESLAGVVIAPLFFVLEKFFLASL